MRQVKIDTVFNGANFEWQDKFQSQNDLRILCKAIQKALSFGNSSTKSYWGGKLPWRLESICLCKIIVYVCFRNHFSAAFLAVWQRLEERTTWIIMNTLTVELGNTFVHFPPVKVLLPHPPSWGGTKASMTIKTITNARFATSLFRKKQS